MSELTIEDDLFDIEEARKIIVNPILSYDFITAFLGSKIGYGCYRAVYNYNLGGKNKFVLKIEPGASNCNINEAQIWSEIKYFTNKLEWVKDWFAPVEWISANGKVLCMQKTQEKPNKKRPDKIPTFLNDVKKENFGWLGNKYVCHDYGQLWNLTQYPSKFKNVTW